MNELGIEHFYIELIEKHPCDSKEELLQKEGEHIRKIGTLNTIHDHNLLYHVIAFWI